MRQGYGNYEINTFLWEEVRKIKDKTKIGEKIYNVLSGDNAVIVNDGDVFWIEEVGGNAYIPEYFWKWTINFLERRGYKYFYRHDDINI